jgi:PKD repeat protein
VVSFGSFTVPPCLACPTLTVTATVAGCAPTNPLVSLSTRITWPSGSGPAPTGDYWTIDEPGSVRRAQRFGAPSVDTSSGWAGVLATPAGAVDLSRAGIYSVSVRAQIPGPPAQCDPTDSASIVIPPCRCPAPTSGQEWNVSNVTAPLGPASFQTTLCDTATVGLSLTVDPGACASADLQYSWDFGDGSPVVTGQGAAAASQNHRFRNPVPGQDRTYPVTVTVSVPGSPCPPFARTASITVPGCGAACPRIGQLSADRPSDCIPPGGSTSLTFGATVSNAAAVSGGFRWGFGDGTTQTTTAPAATHSYSRTGNFTVTVSVEGPAGSGCPTSSQVTTVAVTACDDGAGMSVGCWILLVISVALSLAAAVLGALAACMAFGNPFSIPPVPGVPPTWPPNATTWLIIGAIGAFLLSLLFLLLWDFICVRGTNCRALSAGRHFIMWITRIAPVVAVISGILAGVIQRNVLCGAFFLLGMAILWGYWGLVLSTLDDIALRIRSRCLTEQ